MAKSDSLTVASGQTLNAALSATDALTVTLSYTIVSQPAHGTLKLTSASGSAFTYTPKDGFIGSDSFAWKANNGSDSNIATDSITVTLPTPPPGAPTVSDLSFDVKENVATQQRYPHRHRLVPARPELRHRYPAHPRQDQDHRHLPAVPVPSPIPPPPAS